MFYLGSTLGFIAWFDRVAVLLRLVSRWFSIMPSCSLIDLLVKRVPFWFQFTFETEFDRQMRFELNPLYINCFGQVCGWIGSKRRRPANKGVVVAVRRFNNLSVKCDPLDATYLVLYGKTGKKGKPELFLWNGNPVSKQFAQLRKPSLLHHGSCQFETEEHNIIPHNWFMTFGFWNFKRDSICSSVSMGQHRYHTHPKPSSVDASILY